MLELAGVAFAWLSYAAARAARPPRAPRFAARRPRLFAAAAYAVSAAAFGRSAWCFASAEGALGGALIALVCWTAAGGVFPIVAELAPRAARASLVVASLLAVGAALVG